MCLFSNVGVLGCKKEMGGGEKKFPTSVRPHEDYFHTNKRGTVQGGGLMKFFTNTAKFSAKRFNILPKER